MPKIVNLIGQKFNLLTVVDSELVWKYGRSVRYVTCRCECGNTKKAQAGSVQSGYTKSCGDRAKHPILPKSGAGKGHRPPRNYHKYSVLYNVWNGIKQRCGNPKNKNYHNYGGRGIRMCREWRASFNVFVIWALQNGWISGLTIDRIDNNSGYNPSNCRWVSMETQQNNRRNNIKIQYQDGMYTITELSKKLSIPRSVLYSAYKTDFLPFIFKRI